MRKSLDARCRRCGRKVDLDPTPTFRRDANGIPKATPPREAYPKNTAFRCSWCFNVFCHPCAEKHFKREEDIVGDIAVKLAKKDPGLVNKIVKMAKKGVAR